MIRPPPGRQPISGRTRRRSRQLLNLTNRPIKRLTRELWFETTHGPLTIEPAPSNDRRVAIQWTHDMNNLSKFACHISPDAGDALITMTRNYLQPSQAVTLRWEVSRAAS
jgi:hypothetical protein